MWQADAHELLQAYPALKAAFEYACRTRQAKPAKEGQERVAAIILACETLLRDPSGWGARFSEARGTVVQLFAKVSDGRRWLIEIYGYPGIGTFDWAAASKAAQC